MPRIRVSNASANAIVSLLAVGALLMSIDVGAGMASAQQAIPAASAHAGQQEDPTTLRGHVLIDGSSTVWPITPDAAERFVGMAPQVVVDVLFSGTGGGFGRFCAGETD